MLVRTGVISRFVPVTIVALLLTLVFIFAFQADNIVAKPWHVALTAIPILFQVYMNTSLAYGLMRWRRLRLPYLGLNRVRRWQRWRVY